MKRAIALLGVILGVGCGGSSGGGGGGPVPNQAAPLLVAAGMVRLEPAPVDLVSAGVDLDRLALGPVGAVYELTTPAGEPFTFDLLSRTDDNTGAVRVSVAHAADGGAAPEGGIETLNRAGVVPQASGAAPNGAWYDALGDGFARVSVRGAIDREQVLAVETAHGQGTTTALVSVRIGPASEINVPPTVGGDYPGLLDVATIYSSDAAAFGLPTVAVSGDRTSVVAYEGDQADPYAFARFELRLQHDAATGAVTGGASVETAPDTGNWRDHEIAALFNVLAIARSGGDAVTLRLSFDRGATFPQTETFRVPGLFYASRLVQVAMAADYTLGLVFWIGPELVLVEGRPAAFDGGGSPTAFAFDPPRTLLRGDKDLVPVIMGMDYSEGGDLVIGVGWTSVTWNPATVETKTVTEFHALVRLFGETDFRDTLVERDVTIARDPSVATVGSGPDLTIFFAYEGRDGVRLRVSEDGGATWSDPLVVGERWTYLPTVLAREEEGALRVDLLYLTTGDVGTELHLLHWDDYPATPPATYRLTRATRTDLGPGDDDPPPGPRPLAQFGAPILPPEERFVVTQVAWFGYDATLDGDDVVVVVDEETTDPWGVVLFGVDGRVFEGAAGAPSLPTADAFTPAEPPPLAPGLTEPVRAPDPDHRHQLRLLRLE